MSLSIPEHRLKAVKQFALQILNTTLAVLIALSFEGLVEWRRIRYQVATAQSHMDNEMRENRKDVTQVRSWAGKSIKDGDQLLGLVGALIRVQEEKGAPETPKGEFGVFSWNAILSATARSTADATGVFAHMRYDEVKRYAGVYDYQQHVSRTLERLDEQFLLVKSMFKEDLGKLNLDELKSLRGGLLNLLQILRTVESQSGTMLRFYRDALERR